MCSLDREVDESALQKRQRIFRPMTLGYWRKAPALFESRSNQISTSWALGE